jgi:hypothetical protein
LAVGNWQLAVHVFAICIGAEGTHELACVDFFGSIETNTSYGYRGSVERSQGRPLSR